MKTETGCQIAFYCASIFFVFSIPLTMSKSLACFGSIGKVAQTTTSSGTTYSFNSTSISYLLACFGQGTCQSEQGTSAEEASALSSNKFLFLQFSMCFGAAVIPDQVPTTSQGPQSHEARLSSAELVRRSLVRLQVESDSRKGLTFFAVLSDFYLLPSTSSSTRA